jgi:hypothetical protein
MAVVYAQAQTRSWGGEPSSPEPYSDRSPEVHELDKILVTMSEEAEANNWSGTYEVPDSVTVGSLVWVVYVRYSSGDTFGHVDGLVKIMDVLDEPEGAELLRETLERVGREDTDSRMNRGSVDREYEVEFVGRKYYKPWVGYFEGFGSCEVYQTRVR